VAYKTVALILSDMFPRILDDRAVVYFKIVRSHYRGTNSTSRVIRMRQCAVQDKTRSYTNYK
jgi:hypothetical protein